MRYETVTGLRTGEVLQRARDFFGPTGKVGLDTTEQGINQLLFAGGGGFVALVTAQVAGGSRIQLTTHEFDREVEAFISQLPPATGPLHWLRGRFGSNRATG
ncbi:MAG TPA: hypothetical protein VKU87_00515 [Thermomicrobiaceae bacterium]|nr:hypothetical protein [Thermomicrobiaceae bacterium]